MVTNDEKDMLRRFVLRGMAPKAIEKLGFKIATIRKYYRALNPKGG